MTNEVVPFIEYSKSDYELNDADADIIGFAVYDKNGDHIGHIEEMLLDNSAPPERDQPNTRMVSLAILNSGGLLGNERVMIPFDLFRQADQERREVKLTYPKEFFQHDNLEYRGLNFVDRDAAGQLYGFYDMDHAWFDERAGADPEGVKYG